MTNSDNNTGVTASDNSDLERLLYLVSTHGIDYLDNPCCEVCVEMVSLKSKIQHQTNYLKEELEIFRQNPEYVSQTEKALKTLRTENKSYKKTIENLEKFVESKYIYSNGKKVGKKFILIPEIESILSKLEEK